MEVVKHQKCNQEVTDLEPAMIPGQDINPLYESSEEAQYSSTTNELYGVKDS